MTILDPIILTAIVTPPRHFTDRAAGQDLEAFASTKAAAPSTKPSGWDIQQGYISQANWPTKTGG